MMWLKYSTEVSPRVHPIRISAPGANSYDWVRLQRSLPQLQVSRTVDRTPRFRRVFCSQTFRPAPCHPHASRKVKRLARDELPACAAASLFSGATSSSAPATAAATNRVQNVARSDRQVDLSSARQCRWTVTGVPPQWSRSQSLRPSRAGNAPEGTFDRICDGLVYLKCRSAAFCTGAHPSYHDGSQVPTEWSTRP